MADQETNESSESTTENAENATQENTTEENSSSEKQTEDTGSSTQENGQESFNKESLLSDLHKERTTRKSLQAEVEKLKADVAEATSAKEQNDALQKRYERLESFLSSVGGPISKALDSRSFTTQLFESDTDIKELVDKWNSDNPTATSKALGSGNGATSSKNSLNDLFRAAAH